jgi:hypothetical protein
LASDVHHHSAIRLQACNQFGRAHRALAVHGHGLARTTGSDLHGHPKTRCLQVVAYRACTAKRQLLVVGLIANAPGVIYVLPEKKPAREYFKFLPDADK